ncbi:MAG: hypothetical protein ACMUJJ_11430 [Roseicyclus sp.]|uniref:hypothetical protein n=1 Tax=Roseicyclus sp. TaxID=1914329 RepID=UPI003A83D164
MAMALPALAHGQTASDTLRALDPPDPVVTYTLGEQEIILRPWDIVAVELSESGGITDIFLRLTPEAAETLAATTAQAIGRPFGIRPVRPCHAGDIGRGRERDRYPLPARHECRPGRGAAARSGRAGRDVTGWGRRYFPMAN